MVRYRRNFVAGGTFFFTVVLADRRSRILVEHIAGLRDAFRVTRSERPFNIDAIVVLPDHLHAIMTLPSDDADFSGRWRRLKGLFTRHVAAAEIHLARNARGEHALWQRRFWEHTIRDEEDFARHVDYIHFNPVKHRHVSRVADWPYSSFHDYVQQGILPKDWAGDASLDAGSFGEPMQSRRGIAAPSVVARMERSVMRECPLPARGGPGLRCAPSGLRNRSLRS